MEILMIDFNTEFNDLIPTKKDGYYEFLLPVCMNLSWSRLRLCLFPLADGGYILSDDGGFLGERGNHTTEFYYKHYLKYSIYPNYGIKLKDDTFYKKHDGAYSPLAAINDFIRFFIKLEEHIEMQGIL